MKFIKRLICGKYYVEETPRISRLASARVNAQAKQKNGTLTFTDLDRLTYDADRHRYVNFGG